MTLRDDINDAVKSCGISDFEFLRLTKYEALLNKIASQFLAHGKPDLEYIWLWEHFKEPIAKASEQDPFIFLESRLPLNQQFWFIASDEDGKYWVACGKAKSILTVLKEMYLFEYYIIDNKFNWILCENHHGLLIQSGIGGPIGTEQHAQQ